MRRVPGNMLLGMEVKNTGANNKLQVHFQSYCNKTLVSTLKSHTSVKQHMRVTNSQEQRGVQVLCGLEVSKNRRSENFRVNSPWSCKWLVKVLMRWDLSLVDLEGQAGFGKACVAG